jgi:hypothetical protein
MDLGGNPGRERTLEAGWGISTVRKRNWKQLKLSGGAMRRLTIDAGTRGSTPQKKIGGTRGVWKSQDSDLSQLPVLTVASM